MISRPRRARAPFRALLALGLTLGSSPLGCDGGDSSNPPGGKGEVGDAGGAKAEGGKDYMYAAEGFTLTATTTTKLQLSSSQGAGTQELGARSLIEAKPAGDKLEVHGKVLELTKYVGTGQLDPEFMRKQAEEAGQDAPDLEAEMRRSEGWMIIDLKGERDKEASDALPQNKDAGEDGPSDFGLFGLPDLPKVDLEEGKEVKLPTESDERQLAFAPITVPVEVDVTWVLRKVEGGVAELDVTVESSGATEIDMGGQTALVSMLEEAAFTIEFNLETKLPVSIDGYQASETSLDIPGNPVTITMNTDISSSFEPGASASAEAAPAAGEAPAEGEAPAAGG